MADPIDYSAVLATIAAQLQALNTNITTLANNSTRVRGLMETSGITTRSTHDYLHVASAVKGLELDGESIGDAISAYNKAPPQTLLEPDSSAFPGRIGGLAYKGSWDEDTQYLINDIIELKGQHYVAIKKNKGSPPKNNQIWKTLDEYEVAKSEKPKEVWRGTWQKEKNYSAGSIVWFKEGLNYNYIETLDDLYNHQGSSNLYRALTDIPAYTSSGKKPSDPADPNDLVAWERIDHNLIPDKAMTTILNNIQFISTIGDFTCTDNLMAHLDIDAPVIIEKIPYKLDDFVEMYRDTYDAATYKTRAREIMNYYITNNSYPIYITETLSNVAINNTTGELICTAPVKTITVGSEIVVSGNLNTPSFYINTYRPDIHNPISSPTVTAKHYWTTTTTNNGLKGAWSPTANYVLNDVVTYGAQKYICIKAHNPKKIFNTQILANGQISFDDPFSFSAVDRSIYAVGTITGTGILENYVPTGKVYYITATNTISISATVTLSETIGDNAIVTTQGTISASGDINDYINSTVYKVSNVVNQTTFTIQTTNNQPVSTVIGNTAGLTFVLRKQEARYALARNPDHAGLSTWTDHSLDLSRPAGNLDLNTAFFNNITSIKPGFTRHLTAAKMFDPRNSGGGFFDEPPNWVASGPVAFNWSTRNISSAASATFSAWGRKMNQYAIWEKPGVYNPIVRPISGIDNQYEINVQRPIRISVLGGPPNTTLQVAKSSNKNGMFGTGYVANTILTGTITLDANGNWTDATYFFPVTGTVTFILTIPPGSYTILNGFTRTYTVTVGTNFVEPTIPTNPIEVLYDYVKKLNVGFEFSRTEQINFPFDGTYVFQGYADNWAKVTLDNETLLDWNNNFLDTSKPATKLHYVKKGVHTLKVMAINYGAQTQGNPGGVAVTIASGGSGLIVNHIGSKRYKIRTTDGKNIFRLVNEDDSPMITTMGSGAGYIFHAERIQVNPEITEVAFKGCWERSTNYTVHQMVLHSEKTWAAIMDNVNNEPNSDSRYWREITTEVAKFIDDPPIWRGAWDNNVTYVRNSITSYKDKAWIAKKLVQSVPLPPPPDLAPDDWQVIDDDTIYCQGVGGDMITPTPPITPIDKTLKYRPEPFSTNNVYYPYDVIKTPITNELIFVDPPIIDYGLVESKVLNDEAINADPYDPGNSYEQGDIVEFDDELCVALGSIGPDLTGNNNPLNRPDLWAKLLPELRPLGDTYSQNEVVPLVGKPYLCVNPTTNRPPSADWIEILPNNGVKLSVTNINISVIKPVAQYVDGRALEFIGDWDWRTTYQVNQVVIFVDVLYRAVAESIGAVPPYNITNIDDTAYAETKWVKLEVTLDIF